MTSRLDSLLLLEWYETAATVESDQDRSTPAICHRKVLTRLTSQPVTDSEVARSDEVDTASAGRHHPMMMMRMLSQGKTGGVFAKPVSESRDAKEPAWLAVECWPAALGCLPRTKGNS
jgi:hypothetical protein